MKIYYYPIILLIAGLLYSYWFGYTPVLVSVAYFIASIASYALYAKDKKAARRGAWRVQENTLQLTALLCLADGRAHLSLSKDLGIKLKKSASVWCLP